MLIVCFPCLPGIVNVRPAGAGRRAVATAPQWTCVFLLQCSKNILSHIYLKIIIFVTGETPMKHANMIFGVALLLASSLLPVQAQNPVVASPSAQESPNRCQAEIFKFERILSFIRESQGLQAAALIKEKLLPAKVENEILNKDGYCGLARHLRDKKLTS
ncbi:hypothetical protein [Polaromonas hydrogenivorans]